MDFSAEVWNLSLFFIALFLGLISPGPSVVAIAATTMAQGRFAGLSFALGVACGTATLGLITVLGLGSLFKVMTSLVTGVTIFGALYFCYLAFGAFRRLSRPQVSAAPTRQFSRGSYYKGLAVHLTNPKAIFVWISIVSLGLSPESSPWVAWVIIVGGGLLSLAVNGTYALLFSTEKMLAGYQRFQKQIDFAMGSFFIFAAILLLYRTFFA